MPFIFPKGVRWNHIIVQFGKLPQYVPDVIGSIWHWRRGKFVVDTMPSADVQLDPSDYRGAKNVILVGWNRRELRKRFQELAGLRGVRLTAYHLQRSGGHLVVEAILGDLPKEPNPSKKAKKAHPRNSHAHVCRANNFH